jgi:hypothetical protein
MAGLVPAISFIKDGGGIIIGMPGTRPSMTRNRVI